MLKYEACIKFKNGFILKIVYISKKKYIFITKANAYYMPVIVLQLIYSETKICGPLRGAFEVMFVRKCVNPTQIQKLT